MLQINVPACNGDSSDDLLAFIDRREACQRLDLLASELVSHFGDSVAVIFYGGA